MPPPGIELVVAHYRESLSWLRHVPSSINRVVYAKGAPVADAIPLPNQGREAQTYLHHITSRYDKLADVTVFCQGHPFDHAPGFHRTLRELAAGTLPVPDFMWMGFLIDQDDPAGRLFQNWSKNEDGRGLDLSGFCAAVGLSPEPAAYTFYGGAQFAVTAETIRRRPRKFYEQAHTAAIAWPDAAHCFERCWDRVFGVNGIPAELRAARYPVYLKPIRRLRENEAAQNG